VVSVDFVFCGFSLVLSHHVNLQQNMGKNASRLKRRDERVLDDDTIVQCVHKIRQCAHLLEAAVTALLAVAQSMKKTRVISN
jgi:hypothetical protein